MLKKIGILCSFGLSCFVSHAQHCGTEDPEVLAQKDPAFARVYEMEKLGLVSNVTNKTTQTAQFNNSTRVIPVVVHVIHNNGPEKIPIQQVESQFPALFDDYRAVPGTRGLGGRAVDTGIEFSLATRDPNGNPSTGVVYVQSTLTNHDKAQESSLKALSRWDPTRYLNIYIVKSITNNILGYATFPPSSNSLDGLVIRYECFGSKQYYPNGPFLGGYQYGRVATHEAGHWLSLYHTFQSSCGSSCSNSGDFVCDTPPSFENNFGSSVRQNTCSNDNPDVIDNTRNYMDYLNDLFKDHFTPGQLTRINSTMNNINYSRRFNLWQDNNVQLCGVGPYKKPRANFWSWNQNTVENAPVTLTPYCMGQPDQFFWSCTNGTTTLTSTDPIPTFNFTQAGTYSVTLICTNLTGSDTLTKTNFIKVNPASTIASIPLIEGFDAITFPTNWVVQNQDAIYSGQFWSRTAVTSGFGNSTACARMNLYASQNQGTKDGLITPVMDATNVADLQLSYNYAYSPLDFQPGGAGQTNTMVYDTFSVFVSTDAGNTWTRIYYKGGMQLKTVDTIASDIFLEPKDNEWKNVTINLSAYKGNNRLRLKFETTSGFGNNFMIDDIQITDPLTTSTANLLPHQMLIYPNPANDICTLEYNLPQQADVQWNITDLAGKTIQNGVMENVMQGKNHIRLEQLSAGVYILNIQTPFGNKTEKLVKN